MSRRSRGQGVFAGEGVYAGAGARRGRSLHASGVFAGAISREQLLDRTAPWRAFVQKHKGMGIPRAELSMMYRESKGLRPKRIRAKRAMRSDRAPKISKAQALKALSDHRALDQETGLYEDEPSLHMGDFPLPEPVAEGAGRIRKSHVRGSGAMSSRDRKELQAYRGTFGRGGSFITDVIGSLF